MFSECVWTLMCIIFALFLLISLLVDNGNQRQPQAVNKNFGISCDKKIGPTKWPTFHPKKFGWLVVCTPEALNERGIVLKGCEFRKRYMTEALGVAIRESTCFSWCIFFGIFGLLEWSFGDITDDYQIPTWPQFFGFFERFLYGPSEIFCFWNNMERVSAWSGEPIFVAQDWKWMNRWNTPYTYDHIYAHK